MAQDPTQSTGPLQYALLFDDLTRLATLRPEARFRLPAETPGLVASRLRRFVDERIMVEVGGRYLSLANVAQTDYSVAV